MDIILIWVMTDGEYWLQEAWDQESIDQNKDAFEKKLADIRNVNEDQYVRLQKITVPSGSIHSLFDIPCTEVFVHDPTQSSSIAAPTPTGEDNAD